MTEFFANNTATDYILLALSLTQIPIIFIYATRMYCRMYSDLALTQNTEWIADHPEFTRHISYEKIMRLFANIVAAVSLVSIGYYVFQNPDPLNIVPMLLLPQLALLVGILLYTVALHFRVTRAIPLPDRRKTKLEDQSLSAYVPHWIAASSYVGLLLAVGVYLWALVSGSLPTDLATARLTGLGGIIAIGTGVLVFGLRRKHSELEFMFGENSRKIEVRGAVAVLYLGVLVGLMRILGDFYGISLFQDAFFFIVISFFVQVSMAVMYIKQKATLENHKSETQ